MELRHLRYFVAVAQEGHMTKAAETLGIQQPPLSLQIKDLERELGFHLFTRHPKGMKLTKAGETFLSSSVEILGQVEAAKLQASRAHLGLVGELVIGVTTSVAAHHLFSNIIKSYRDLYPLVQMTIQENNADELTQQLLSHELSLALMRLPVLPSMELRSHVLLEEPVLLAIPKDHALLKNRPKGQEKLIHVKELAREQLILVRKPGSPGMYENLLLDCRANGFEPQVVAEVDNMLTNINLVAAGVGVSVVPASMSCFHQHAVVYCSLEGVQRVKAPITMLVHKGEQSLLVDNFSGVALNQSKIIMDQLTLS